MSGKVVLSTAATESFLGPFTRTLDTDVKPVAEAAASEAPIQADLRLMIEEGTEQGQYVYTLVDRRTGRVVRRLTREEVMRLGERSNYSAGAVFDGTA